MRKPIIALAVVIGLVFIAAAAAVAQSGSGDKETTNKVAPTGKVQGSNVIFRGSDTTYSVSSLLGNLYTFTPNQTNRGRVNENRNADVILNAPPAGSSTGISQLVAYSNGVKDSFNNPTFIARSSRGPRDTDPAGLKFTAFAKDGIVPVTFGGQGGPASSVDNLTTDQLRGIFVDCSITNFNQIGGEDAPIVVYGVQANSGTKATFDDFLGGDTNSCASEENIIFENSANPISDIDQADRERAIFYFSFARLSTSVPNPDVVPVAVNGVDAGSSTISDSSYPFTRNVYFVTLNDNSKGDYAANRAADRFVDWVCKPRSEHGKDPITKNNYGDEIDGTIRASGFGNIDCSSISTR